MCNQGSSTSLTPYEQHSHTHQNACASLPHVSLRANKHSGAICGDESSHCSHTGIVGVIQLGDALDLAVLHRRALFIELRLSFELHPVEYALHNPTVGCLWVTKTSCFIGEPKSERGGEGE